MSILILIIFLAGGFITGILFMFINRKLSMRSIKQYSFSGKIDKRMAADEQYMTMNKKEHAAEEYKI